MILLFTFNTKGGVDADVPFDEKGATYKNVQGNIAVGSGGGGLVSNGILQICYLKSVYIHFLKTLIIAMIRYKFLFYKHRNTR